MKQWIKIKTAAENEAKMHDKGKVVDRNTQLQRIEKIFEFYAKNNSRDSRYFEDITHNQKKMHIETFQKFIKDWKLNRILSID